MAGLPILSTTASPLRSEKICPEMTPETGDGSDASKIHGIMGHLSVGLLWSGLFTRLSSWKTVPLSRRLIKDTPSVYQLAGGFSTTWKNTEFHGEALYSYSIHKQDESYINYVGGLCHTSEKLASNLGLEKLICCWNMQAKSLRLIRMPLTTF